MTWTRAATPAKRSQVYGTIDPSRLYGTGESVLSLREGCAAVSPWTLEDDREEWVTGLCDGVIESLGDVGQDLIEAVRPDLGPSDLTAALAATWTAHSVSLGEPRHGVVEQVFAARLLDPDAASQSRIEHLVDTIEARVAARGLPASEPWQAGSGFMLLLEMWAAQQAEHKPTHEIARLLRAHWKVSDQRSLSYLKSLRPRPLEDHLTLTRRLEQDGRELVQALVAQAFTMDRVHGRREAIMDAMHVSDIEHLRALAVDMTTTTLLDNSLRAYGEKLHLQGNHEGAIAAAGAQYLLDDTRNDTVKALGQLAVYEVGRLRIEPELHFQNACLDALTCRYKTTVLNGDRCSTHGTYGAMPWWRIAVSDSTRDQAWAILNGHSAGLGVRQRDARGTVEIHLGDQEGRPLHAFTFAMNSVTDALELLLLGRVGTVGIDFSENVSPSSQHLGTARVHLSDEHAETICRTATRALRDHLGFSDDFEPYRDVRDATDYALDEEGPESIWSRPSWQFDQALQGG